MSEQRVGSDERPIERGAAEEATGAEPRRGVPADSGQEPMATDAHICRRFP
jgi:hypothetical protein